MAKKGEGTFSEVLKAQSVKTGRYTAIKCMKNKFDSIEQVRPRVALSGDPTVEVLQLLLPQPAWRWSLALTLTHVSCAGEQPARDPGAAPALAAPEHHQPDRGAVRSAHGAASSGVRAHAAEHL